jgi:hypothetical protein
MKVQNWEGKDGSSSERKRERRGKEAIDSFTADAG